MNAPTKHPNSRVTLLFCLALSGCALCLVSCKKEAAVDAGKRLEQSFQVTEPPVRQAIATATTSLKAGNYTEAARVLDPVLTGRNLTSDQRQALGLAFQQISQAVAANPSLDTPEVYQFRVRLAHAARGDRF